VPLALPRRTEGFEAPLFSVKGLKLTIHKKTTALKNEAAGIGTSEKIAEAGVEQMNK
jgi:hypothetical protein